MFSPVSSREGLRETFQQAVEHGLVDYAGRFVPLNETNNPFLDAGSPVQAKRIYRLDQDPYPTVWIEISRFMPTIRITTPYRILNGQILGIGIQNAKVAKDTRLYDELGFVLIQPEGRGEYGGTFIPHLLSPYESFELLAPLRPWDFDLVGDKNAVGALACFERDLPTNTAVNSSTTLTRMRQLLSNSGQTA